MNATLTDNRTTVMNLTQFRKSQEKGSLLYTLNVYVTIPRLCLCKAKKARALGVKILVNIVLETTPVIGGGAIEALD